MQKADFSWFDKEMKRVKWSTFYVTRRNFTLESLRNLGLHQEDLPEDYLTFLLKYGEALLFRKFSSMDSHYMSVLAPSLVTQHTSVPMLLIGGYWTEGRAYLIQDEIGVYSNSGTRPTKISESFEAWFCSRFNRGKRQYKSAEWKTLESPPRPFSPAEEAIAKALPRYSFKKVGVDPGGNVLIEVHNGSDQLLDWANVGVRAKDILEGGAIIPVGHIRPGETKIICRPCYKRQVSADEIDLFPFREPTPEDRECFEELLNLNRAREGSACARSGLHSAVYLENSEEVKLWLDRGVYPNFGGAYGELPLQVAVNFKNTTIVEDLLRAGAIAELKDRKGLNAWQVAEKVGFRNQLENLLQRVAPWQIP
jgi:hypothetical protein